MSKKNKEITTIKIFILLIINIFKFIVFPIRKPLVGIPFIFLLFIIPTFNGVKPSEVHLWYLKKLNPITQGFVNFGQAINKHSIEPIKETVSKLIDNDGNYVSDDTRLRTSTDLEPRSNQNHSTKENNEGFSKRIFEKAKNSSTTYKVDDNIIANTNTNHKKIDLEVKDISNAINDETTDKTGESKENTDDNLAEEIKNIESKNESIIKSDKAEEVVIKPIENIETIIKENTDLRFITKPEFIEGIAQIENANMIVINKRRIYLHGIYTNPYSEKGMAAVTYLINLIHDKNVRCDIMAYTSNDIPTAICYSSGKNINEELVKVGLSQKVELK